MFIVIDNQKMVGFVQCPTLEQAKIHGDRRLKGDYLIVNPNQRRDLSPYSIGQLGVLIKNTQGKPSRILTGYGDAIAHAWEVLVDHTPKDETPVAALVKKHGEAREPDPMPTFDSGRAPYNPEKDPDALAARARRVTQATVRATTEGDARTPRPTKATGAVPTRPREGTTTAKVWAIADTVHKPGEAITKATREAIIAACTKEGIDPSTAATQYSKWKRAMEAAA